MEMAVFKGFLNADPLSNLVGQRASGSSTWRTQKGCVCVEAQSIFVSAVVPVDRASRPLSEMAGRVAKEAKTPIFIGF
jgi:hypothetical protein